MLFLRQSQIDALEQQLFHALQMRVERAIAGTFPELGGDAAEPGEPIRGIVERGIESSVAYDIQETADIAAFIALGLALGISRPKASDWIKGWLERPDTPGATRLQIIEKQLAAAAAGDAALAAVGERVAKARREAGA